MNQEEAAESKNKAGTSRLTSGMVSEDAGEQRDKRSSYSIEK